MQLQHSIWSVAFGASACLLACARGPAGGAEVHLDLEVSGGRPGTYVATVFRADGVPVAETKRRGRAADDGERVELTAPCDPSPEAQPNRLEIELDPVTGTIPPGRLVFPFACDDARVDLVRSLGLARATGERGWSLGGKPCALSHDGSSVEVVCDHDVGLDDVRVLCDGAESVVPLATSAASDAALPWATVDVALEAGAEDGQSRVRVTVSPLFFDAPCTQRWRFGGRGHGLWPVVSFEAGADGLVGPAVDYGYDPSYDGDFASERACTPACDPGRCADDGCGRSCCATACADDWCAPRPAPRPFSAREDDDGVSLEATLEVPPQPLPSDGVLAIVRVAGDDVHVWELFVPYAGGPPIALRDGEAPPSGRTAGGGFDPRGHLAVHLPDRGAVTAVIVDRPSAARRIEIVAAGRDGLGRARLLGDFPIALAADAPVIQSPTQLAVATEASTIALRGALSRHPSWCEALGACLAVTVGDRLGPLVAPHPRPSLAELEELLAGDDLAVSPVALGADRLVALGTGREACWVATGDGPLVVAFDDGTALRIDGGVIDRRGAALQATVIGRGGCAAAPAPSSRVWLPEGVARTDIAAVGASFTRAAGPLTLVAVWGDRADGWIEADRDATVYATSDAVALAADGWSSPLDGMRVHVPAAAIAGPVWLVDGDGQRSNAVWMPVIGADSDGDGAPDERDPCPRVAGLDADRDHDGLGDACDTDADGDGWDDAIDRCPGIADPAQDDRDHDGAGDPCDAFPDDPTEDRDSDGDGFGDRSETALCGNGRLDPGLGEECDDGNNASGDGCEPSCRLACGAELGATRAILDARTGHCFMALPERLDQRDASARCEALGGALPIPDDALENAYAFALGGGWLGLEDRLLEGQFQTLRGDRPAFEAWDFSEPSVVIDGSDDDCVAFARTSARWDALPCGELHPVLCERAESSCGDGVRQRLLGEECDDGNEVVGDGCSPSCRSDCASPAHPETAPEQRRIARDPRTGHCFVELAEGNSWREAQDACGAIGGYLAIPDDAREAALIETLAPGFIGLHFAGYRGAWTVGAKPAPWRDERLPDQTGAALCVALDATGRPVPVECRLERAALCEIERDPCGDGVIQTALGETCDPDMPDPGCDFTCRHERPRLAGRPAIGAPDGSTLVLMDGTASWVQARAACEQLGGHLPVPDDVAELARLVALGRGWLGVDDLRDDHVFVTVSHAPAPFIPSLSRMNESSPYDHCHVIDERLVWTDGNCALDFPYTCELAPATCGDGVIQVGREACDGPDCPPDCGPACGHDLAPRPDLAIHDGDRCVYGYLAAMTRDEAAARCADGGGALYVPGGVVADRLAGDLGIDAWMGLDDRDLEGAFVDPDGLAPLLDGWGADAPDDGLGFVPEDCAVMSADGAWNDVPCDGRHAVLCARTGR